MSSSSWPRFIARAFVVVLLSLAQPPVGAVAYHGSSMVSASSGITRQVPGDFPDIQSAINASAAGDTILVAPGTYTASLDFNGKAVTLQSTQGPATTAIVGVAGRAVTIGPQAMISGFTISSTPGAFGGGMIVIGDGTVISGNIFTNNDQPSGDFGAAIGGNGASPVIERNIFRNNSCDGQFTSGVVSFVNTSSPRVVDNIFDHNPCRAVNMSLPTGSNPVVINNTIVANDGGIYIDARVSTSTHVYRNNILVKNIIGMQVNFGSDVNNPPWENNLVFGNTTNYDGVADQTGSQHNISIDPLFIDASSSRYQLQTTSPAIDAGTNNGCPANDFSGISRPQGLLCDIGAHEVIQTHISFANTSYRVSESTAVYTVSVRLDQALPITATVDYATADGEPPFAAIAGQDYLPNMGTLIFTPGITEQHFTIVIMNDKLVEHDENLHMILSHGSVTNSIVYLDAPTRLTIIDNNHRSYLPLI